MKETKPMPTKRKTVIIRESRSPKTIPPKLSGSRKPPGGKVLKIEGKDSTQVKAKVTIIREPRSPSTTPPKLDDSGKPPGGKPRSTH